MNKIILTPIQKFLKIEGLSGILLFAATAIALIWANSPFAETYNSIWQHKITIDIPGFEISKPIILWINDGLMAIFFFVIGLEIKRELLIGELNSVKKATLPVFAAIGGMAFPVLVFFILNNNPETFDGWAIPMATDIAFTLAVLKLLGNRIPLSLKIFLTAFAIVDDIGAVLVIAIFYSSSIAWNLLVIAGILLTVLYTLSYKGIYAKYIIVLFGIIIWFLFLKSGVHPTVAGILIALAVPIRQRVNTEVFVNEINAIVQNIKKQSNPSIPILTSEQISEIDNLEDLTSKLQSPLQHFEHHMHSYVAYFIMPLFALANAGVSINLESNLDFTLAIIIAASLVLGNTIGVFSMSYLSLKTKIASLPGDMNYIQLLGVSCLAGLGFTMSIFIANLAFTGSALYIDSAKIGILLGSIVSGLLGYFILIIGSKKINV